MKISVVQQIFEILDFLVNLVHTKEFIASVDFTY